MRAAGMALLLTPGAALPQPRDVRLLPSGSGTVRFAVAVPEARMVNPEPMTLPVAIDGYESGPLSGSLALPERVLRVAVPASGAVRVFATASEAEERSMATVSPSDHLAGGNRPVTVEAAGPAAVLLG